MPTTTVAPVPAPGEALLIKHGWDLPRPGFIRDHAARMDQSGFDGVVTTMDALSGRINSQTPVSEAEIRAVLSPLAGLPVTKLRHNFVIVYSGDHRVFDDNAIPLQNFRNLARVAREVGLAGIVFDNESYDGGRWEWPQQAQGHSLQESQQQALLRGNQAMSAMIAEWPDITVMSLFGPWVSDPGTAQAYAGTIPYNDISWANELMGPYFVGMVEAARGTGGTIIDGGENYTLRSAAQFDLAYQWAKHALASQSAFVPDALRSAYGDAVSVGFGVYDSTVIGVGMDAAVWRQTLTHALARTDRYVWAYTEAYDWWGTGWPGTRVPQAWLDATWAARTS